MPPSRRTGTADLPLHGGKAPAWLFSRMTALSREIVVFMASEFGTAEILRRLSDPHWFQAFACVLGFDWHSSGVTTTATGALKEGVRGLEDELGLYVAGGKGKTSRRTPSEITAFCERLGRDPAPLVRASKVSAKVDNTAVQSSHQLYHHSFLFTADGGWAVIQQGMSDETGTARRFHWLSEEVESFVEEPHAAVCDDARGDVLVNFVASESAEARAATVEIAASDPKASLDAIARASELVMPRRHELRLTDVNPAYLDRILLKTYARAPRDFEELLGIEGVGPKTLRSLALVAELVYGTKASTRDPARYAFAHGGKDGTPFPVDRGTYDRTVEILEKALNGARGVDRSERVKAFRRLARFAEPSQQLAAEPR
ncbi:MAG TPA: DUF763 domain-containing protein [Thermoleophilaceae bacterium]|jgi:hypothetical protein